MARYIDAVECAVIISDKFNIHLADLVDVFAEIPTADVVPRAELEEAEAKILRLQNSLNNYALQYGTVRGQQKVIDKAKAEVASEIFAEIEEIMGKYLDSPLCNYHKIRIALAELKKKYTEDKG